jgi:hypothetical protein
LRAHGGTPLFTGFFLLADLRALAALGLEEMGRRRWAARVLIDTRHAGDSTTSKDKCVVVGDLVYNIEAAKLGPPPNGGAMVNFVDTRPKTVYEFVRRHPREVRHILATLEGQLTARFIILFQN